MITKLHLAILIVLAASITRSGAEQVPKVNERSTRNFHYVQIVIYPKESIRAGASWRLDRSPWQDSKNVLVIGAGKHLVEFAPVEGFKTPERQKLIVSASDRDFRITAKLPSIHSQDNPTVDISTPNHILSNGGAVIPGSDQPGTPFILYNLTGKITPKGAIDAGARWKIDGTLNFYRSGDSVFLPPAKYTVRFRADIPKWYPDNRTVEADLRTGDVTVVGNYHRTN